MSIKLFLTLPLIKAGLDLLLDSRRMHFIYQPAFGAFYGGGPFSFKEVLNARDPWSGWIHYNAGLIAKLGC